MGRIATFVNLLRTGRWGDLRANLQRRTFPRRVFFHNKLVFCRLVDMPPLRIRLDHVEVRPATPEDIPLLQQIRPRSSGYEEAFGKNHACFIAISGDRPAAYSWYICGGVHSSPTNGYEIELGEQACYSYGIEVHPDFRMKGAMIKLWHDSVRMLSERGFQKTYAAIPEENQLSVKSHTRMGFEPLFTFTVSRFLGISRYSQEYVDGSVISGSGTLRWRDPEL